MNNHLYYDLGVDYIENMTLQLSDLMGRIVYQDVLFNQRGDLSLDLNTGIYLVNLFSGGKMTYSTKILIAK